MQTSYPVFESGQVLSATHLNDLTSYLEEHDRLTRSKLIGIGILCGLEVSYEPGPPQDQIRISRGCAVTSEGYIVVLDESVLTQTRSYTLPVPQVEEAPEGWLDEAPYPFFHDEDGEQVPLWELLPADFTPAPGEPPPSAVDDALVQDKVALLFLERNLESLKNCDISDCGDRGMEVEFALRTLLVDRDEAQAMLDQEEQIAQRPVDRHNHPRYELQELYVEKINPAAHGIDNFAELLFRALEVASDLAPRLMDALEESYAAFEYLLGDMFPAAAFPNGPFSDPDYFARIFQQLARNIFLGQYFYAYAVDLVEAYNEFLRAAVELDAECCPAESRFPRHVLLGLVVERPEAFDGDGSAPGFDPLSANTGFGPATRPAAFRHHFVPSPLHGRHDTHPGLEEVRSLYYRLYLLAFRYTLDDLLEAPIRITPSKDGDIQLSDRAVPFYYALLAAGQKAQDDLVHTWSFANTVRNRLDRLFSYHHIDPANHPLLRRMDGHNFYRVEGTVGKGLGQAMRELLEQKRELGLSFAIEPVYIGVGIGDDPTGLALNQEARGLAQQALFKLLLCRMRDLDVIFLVLMAALFQYLLAIIRLLARANTSQLAGLAVAPQSSLGVSLRQPELLQLHRREAERLLRQIRPSDYMKGTVTAKMTTKEEPNQAIGGLYQQIKTGPTSSNLFDRTRDFAQELAADMDADADEVTRRIYPAVSLLDKAEELVATVGAPSLADFDFQQFEQRYDGFVQAYEAYITRPDPGEGAPVAELDQGLGRQYGSIAATAPQSVITSLVSEFQERVRNFLMELLLEGYAQRHPGLEHKGGVPVGGTLVLLYTHRSFVAEMVEEHRELFDEQLNAARNRFGEAGDSPGIDEIDKILAVQPAPDDPLSDFVILGDLCLPYLCCDTDCSDIDLEPGDKPPPPPPPPPPPGGTVIVGLPAGFDRLDPNMTTFSRVGSIGLHVADPLVWRTGEGEIAPHLASEWEVSDDGTEWVFQLRDDVVFHDGTPFNADSVKFTFDRIANRQNGSQLAISHLGPYEESEVVDDRTVRVRFTRPYRAFLNHLTGPTLVPISPAAFEEAGEEEWGLNHLVGTGPFMLEALDPDNEIILVRNPDYNWGPSALDHSGPALLETLIYRFIADDNARTLMLEGGEIQFEDPVPPSDVERVQVNSGLAVAQFPLVGSGWGLVFNHRRQPTAEFAVRRAMQLAMDRKAMTDVVFRGLGIPSCGPLTHVVPCYDEGLCELIERDPEQAIAILEEAGWVDEDGDGIRERDNQPLVLDYFFPANVPLAAQMAEFAMQNFTEIGIGIALRAQPDDAYFQVVRAGRHHLQAWWETGIDPNLLCILFHSSNARGGTNRSNYIDEEMDALIAKAAAGSNLAPADERCEVYQSIQQKVKDEAVMEFWCDPLMVYGHVSGLSGVHYYHDGNIPYFYAASL